MTGEALVQWRREQRRALLAARAGLSPEVREAACRSIFRAADALLAAKGFRTVGAYLPIQNEPDPLPWMTQFMARGGQLALPAVVGKGEPMVFYRWQPGEALVSGGFGTSRPASQIALQPEGLLVPLVGFDQAGYRLGYGGGYYDRTLSAVSPRPFALGVGFRISRMETIYPQPWDIPLDAIVQDEGPAHENGPAK